MSAAARSDCACVWTGALASGYPPEVPRFLPKLWLLLLASVLALGSSSALRLCVHEGSVGFEPVNEQSWSSCYFHKKLKLFLAHLNHLGKQYFFIFYTL